MPEQETFVDLKELLPKLAERLAKDGYKDHSSSALYSLLRAFESEINGLSPSYFHKAFRQIEVINYAEGKIDSAIWHLLSESKTFWEVVMEMYFKESNRC